MAGTRPNPARSLLINAIRSRSLVVALATPLVVGAVGLLVLLSAVVPARVSGATTVRAATAHRVNLPRYSTSAPRTSTTSHSSLQSELSVRPSSGAPLDTSLQLLVRALRSGNPKVAQSVFFPESAYVQIKDITNPAGDWYYRLWALFALDVAAYHRALYPPHSTTRYLGPRVNPADAGWIPAGVCETRVGYWHMAPLRLVFRRGRQLVSVGVFSLISWRAKWYVIHLGPNPRASNVGTLDNLLVGSPGKPGPPGSC